MVHVMLPRLAAAAVIAAALWPDAGHVAASVMQAGVPKSAALFLGGLLLVAPRR